VPNKAVPMHDAPEMYDEHWPISTWVMHVGSVDGEHCSQLWVSQSEMQPVSWLHVEET